MPQTADPHEAKENSQLELMSPTPAPVKQPETPASATLKISAPLKKQLVDLKTELTKLSAQFKPEKQRLLNPLSDIVAEFPTPTDEETKAEGETITIKNLQARFEKICAFEAKFEAYRIDNIKNKKNKLTDKTRIALEEYKQAIIQATLDTLRKKHGQERIPEVPPTTRLRMRNYWGLTALGAIYYFFDGYVNSHSILESIASSISPLLILLPIAFGLVSGILFYTLEAQSLKEELGISERVPANKLLDIYDNKYDNVGRAADILQKPANDKKISIKHEEDYLNLLKSFQKDFRTAQDRQVAQKSNTNWKKNFWKYTVLGLGGIISSFDGYFLATSLITILAGAAFATSPVGWALAAVFMVIAVVFYYVLQNKGLLDLLDPMKNINDTREKNLASTDNAIKSRFEHLETLKNNVILKEKVVEVTKERDVAIKKLDKPAKQENLEKLEKQEKQEKREDKFYGKSGRYPLFAEKVANEDKIEIEIEIPREIIKTRPRSNSSPFANV